MDENILETRIKQRCDTESNWNASNPILLENEVGYIPDGRFKMGDGSSTWSQLPYNNANSANTATKATQDSAGQQINTTYIKGLSVSGTTVTYTKGDGSTGTIKTQDTIYSTATSSEDGLMSSSDKSKLDKLPSPTTSDNDKILSVANGTWSLITVTNAEGVKY